MNLSRSMALMGFFALLPALSGCFGSSKGGNVLDSRFGDDSEPPYTELFIEYPGPSDKWVGPPSLTAHLTAEGGKKSELSISHSGFNLSSARPDLSLERGREQLEKLRIVIHQETKEIQNCSAPVRVRLVRADGALIAKEGCRGQTGWPRVVSDLTAQWLSIAFASSEKQGHVPSQRVKQ